MITIFATPDKAFPNILAVERRYEFPIWQIVNILAQRGLSFNAQR